MHFILISANFQMGALKRLKYIACVMDDVTWTLGLDPLDALTSSMPDVQRLNSTIVRQKSGNCSFLR